MSLPRATDPSHALVRTIGRWSLIALMVNSIIGGGIFGLPSLLAAKDRRAQSTQLPRCGCRHPDHRGMHRGSFVSL